MNLTPSRGNSDAGVDVLGIDMESVYRTLARVLVLLDETGYTEDHIMEEMRQVAVMVHNDPPDPTSEDDTRKAEI